MITVEKAEKFRTCNVCHSKKDVYNMVFRYEGTNQGNQIVLCDNCIKDLIQKLNCSEIPTVEERKTGKWIVHYECPKCGEIVKDFTEYCPFCSTDMRGET